MAQEAGEKIVMEKDEIIELDTPFAKELGFTSDRFDGWLWQKGDVLIVSFIISKQPGKGYFGRLIDEIKEKGFSIQVPTPSARMETILKARGFVPRVIWDDTYKDTVEIMEWSGDSVNALSRELSSVIGKQVRPMGEHNQRNR